MFLSVVVGTSVLSAAESEKAKEKRILEQMRESIFSSVVDVPALFLLLLQFIWSVLDRTMSLQRKSMIDHGNP